VTVDIPRLHRHPSIWNPDPEEFRAERFAALTPTQYRYALVSFGVGAARCLGRSLAYVLLKLVTMRVLEAYEMGRPGEESVAGAGKGGDSSKFTVDDRGEVEFRRR
jgi:cytochrome P450